MTDISGSSLTLKKNKTCRHTTYLATVIQFIYIYFNQDIVTLKKHYTMC